MNAPRECNHPVEVWPLSFEKSHALLSPLVLCPSLVRSMSRPPWRLCAGQPTQSSVTDCSPLPCGLDAVSVERCLAADGCSKLECCHWWYVTITINEVQALHPNNQRAPSQTSSIRWLVSWSLSYTMCVIKINLSAWSRFAGCIQMIMGRQCSSLEEYIVYLGRGMLPNHQATQGPTHTGRDLRPKGYFCRTLLERRTCPCRHRVR